MNERRAAIDELFDLLQEAGAEVTLHGKPTTREQVRRVALEQAEKRLAKLPKKCSLCDGDGSLEATEAYMMMQRPKCPRCKGSGNEPTVAK